MLRRERFRWVLRLIASSNLVGWKTGMLAGFASLRIWPTMTRCGLSRTAPASHFAQFL